MSNLTYFIYHRPYVELECEWNKCLKDQNLDSAWERLIRTSVVGVRNWVHTYTLEYKFSLSLSISLHSVFAQCWLDLTGHTDRDMAEQDPCIGKVPSLHLLTVCISHSDSKTVGGVTWCPSTLSSRLSPHCTTTGPPTTPRWSGSPWRRRESTTSPGRRTYTTSRSSRLTGTSTSIPLEWCRPSCGRGVLSVSPGTSRSSWWTLSARASTACSLSTGTTSWRWWTFTTRSAS